ncbi:MAG: ABC transporter substrate-binding protein, partial [Euryarchaeota archaeon]|nr:ABC transporter substrate-binding protein [Euryarchaeota archaeon]
MRLNRMLVGMTMTMLLLALPAAASDYTLKIFGNANEDDTINMQDVTYTELIILEYRDKTELSDAKHDNKINMQDVTQIELVIL